MTTTRTTKRGGKEEARRESEMLTRMQVMVMQEVVARVEKVFFADEAIVVQNVQLFPGRQLLATDQAGEAVHVKDAGSRSPTNHVRGQDALLTPGALCPELPDDVTHTRTGRRK